MQTFTLAAALFAGLAVTTPFTAPRQVYTPCSGLYDTSQCCATDVLGVADLDCANPVTTPTSADNFSAICAELGQRARCCVLPIVSPRPPRLMGQKSPSVSSLANHQRQLEQGILCETPTGVTD